MTLMTYFGTEQIVEQSIAGSDLHIYTLGYELGNPRVDAFVSLLIEVIPEFAYGIKDEAVPQNQLVARLREAAKSIYTIPESVTGQLTKGELGELILHLFLRDFYNSVPLISSIYFKDSDNVAVHGFDAVHVVPEGNTLWLGESKFYKDGKAGIKKLVESIQEHFEKDYLRRQFALISKKVSDDFPEKDKWLALLNEKQSLDEIFKKIVIPCLCTYDSNIYESHQEASKAFKEQITEECDALKKLFDDSNSSGNTSNLDVILLLFPVPSKSEMSDKFNHKLWNLQNV